MYMLQQPNLERRSQSCCYSNTNSIFHHSESYVYIELQQPNLERRSQSCCYSNTNTLFFSWSFMHTIKHTCAKYSCQCVSLSICLSLLCVFWCICVYTALCMYSNCQASLSKPKHCAHFSSLDHFLFLSLRVVFDDERCCLYYYNNKTDSASQG